MKLGLRRIVYRPADAAPKGRRGNRTRPRLRLLALLLQGRCIEQCPGSGANRERIAFDSQCSVKRRHFSILVSPALGGPPRARARRAQSSLYETSLQWYWPKLATRQIKSATDANSAPSPNNGWWRCAEPDTATPRWVYVCPSGGKVQSLREAGQELSASSRRSFHSTAKWMVAGPYNERGRQLRRPALRSASRLCRRAQTRR